jgi:hypothetical protein
MQRPPTCTALTVPLRLRTRATSRLGLHRSTPCMKRRVDRVEPTTTTDTSHPSSRLRVKFASDSPLERARFEPSVRLAKPPTPTNLPAPTSDLIGRDGEIGKVICLVAGRLMLGHAADRLRRQAPPAPHGRTALSRSHTPGLQMARTNSTTATPAMTIKEAAPAPPQKPAAQPSA